MPSTSEPVAASTLPAPAGDLRGSRGQLGRAAAQPAARAVELPGTAGDASLADGEDVGGTRRDAGWRAPAPSVARPSTRARHRQGPGAVVGAVRAAAQNSVEPPPREHRAEVTDVVGQQACAVGEPGRSARDHGGAPAPPVGALGEPRSPLPASFPRSRELVGAPVQLRGALREPEAPLRDLAGAAAHRGRCPSAAPRPRRRPGRGWRPGCRRRSRAWRHPAESCCGAVGQLAGTGGGLLVVLGDLVEAAVHVLEVALRRLVAESGGGGRRRPAG